jgi:hypothetical protein
VLAAFLIVLICASPIAPLVDGNILIGIEATAMAVRWQRTEQDLQIILARKPEMRPAVLAAYATASAEGGASYREHRPRSRSLFSDAATKEDSLILNSARLPEVWLRRSANEGSRKQGSENPIKDFVKLRAAWCGN